MCFCTKHIYFLLHIWPQLYLIFHPKYAILSLGATELSLKYDYRFYKYLETLFQYISEWRNWLLGLVFPYLYMKFGLFVAIYGLHEYTRYHEKCNIYLFIIPSPPPIFTEAAHCANSFSMSQCPSVCRVGHFLHFLKTSYYFHFQRSKVQLTECKKIP